MAGRNLSSHYRCTECSAESLKWLGRCTSCQAFRHPPRPICPYCRSFDAHWEDVPGSGTLFSYTVVHTPFHPSVRDVVPYVIAVIELDGTGGTRFLSNLVDAPLDGLRAGMPVEVVWEDMSEQLTVPRFRLRTTAH